MASMKSLNTLKSPWKNPEKSPITQIPMKSPLNVISSSLVDGLEHVFFMTFHILGIIIPADFHIFQRGWNHQPDQLEDSEAKPSQAFPVTAVGSATWDAGKQRPGAMGSGVSSQLVN